MKAATIMLNGHNNPFIEVKKGTEAHLKSEFLKNISPEIIDAKKPQLLIVPVDKLTEAQLKEIHQLEGAYLAYTDENRQPASVQNIPSERNATTEKQRFLVKHSTKLLSIEVDQIAFFYAENRLNFIRTFNNRTYIIDKTIEEITQIINKKDFFRINRSYIVSYKSIEETYTHFNNRLKLKLNINVQEELFVSKDRVADFKEWLGA